MSPDGCCDRFEWAVVADFDSAGGIDFDFGRCGACGAAVMRCWWSGVAGYEVLTEAQAHRFLALQSHPAALKAALKRWFDELP